MTSGPAVQAKCLSFEALQNERSLDSLFNSLVHVVVPFTKTQVLPLDEVIVLLVPTSVARLESAGSIKT